MKKAQESGLILPRTFYARSPLLVAPDLLGKILVRKYNDQFISGRIVETEAYLGFSDAAAHAYRGKTPSTAALFMSAGHAYIHSIHMQKCIDIVTEKEDVPTSVLIRALEPIQGIELMQQFRHREKLTELTSGPGKLTQALQIDKTFDGVDVTDNTSQIYIISDNYEVKKTVTRRRIGISKAQEKEYRFYIDESAFVSRK